MLLPCILFGLGLLLFVVYISVTGQAGASRLFEAPATELKTVQLLYGTLPRFVVALVAGALLGLSTTLMQQGLGNPLAEPGTIGLLSSSRLAVACTLIFLPGFTGSVAVPVLGGSLLALVIVLGLSMRWGLSPLFLILNGLVFAMLCDAVTSMLILSHYDELADLLLWQSGSLVQDNWQVAQTLTVCLVALTGIILLLKKPLTLLDLDDAAVASLGLSPTAARLAAVGLAAVAAAVVTAQIGLLAFVGLAGAALARLCGARRFTHRMALSGFLSAALLLLTDQSVQLAEGLMAIPAGTITALFAAPVLLILLHSGRTGAKKGRVLNVNVPARIRATPGMLFGVFVVLMITVILSLTVGRTPDGFTWTTANTFFELLPWRWPRAAGALSAGGMIALSGYLMQRMTGNPLASPELIGVSSGATLVMLPVIALLPPLGRTQTMVIAATGALLFLVLALRLARRSNYAPEKLLLTGLAITALSGSLLSAAIYFGDVRVTRLIGWLSGSTYAVSSREALTSLAVLLAVLAVLPLTRRWLSMLPLGEAVATSVGIEIKRARFVLIVLVAVLTGTATVIIGPVTFVGLVVPHLVRLMGARRPLAQAAGSMLAGAALMTASDWIGRIIAFPWDVPAGLVASVVGALFYGLTARRGRR
ncbi:iron complex transport system permease protein [Rhizobium sp. PP-CC-2G-626]|nr:iron complex transport system permease protein [Rhizobium sp. PP-CC-2G-626]